MNSIIITPKSEQEYRFVNELLKKMKLNFKTLSDEEKEDAGLMILMKQADRSRKVKKNIIMHKLRKKNED